MYLSKAFVMYHVSLYRYKTPAYEYQSSRSISHEKLTVGHTRKVNVSIVSAHKTGRPAGSGCGSAYGNNCILSCLSAIFGMI